MKNNHLYETKLRDLKNNNKSELLKTAVELIACGHDNYKRPETHLLKKNKTKLGRFCKEFACSLKKPKQEMRGDTL